MATPAPMTTVPFAWSQRSERMKLPSVSSAGSPSRPRLRIVKGNRMLGRKSINARLMWSVRSTGNQFMPPVAPGPG